MCAIRNIVTNFFCLLNAHKHTFVAMKGEQLFIKLRKTVNKRRFKKFENSMALTLRTNCFIPNTFRKVKKLFLARKY